MISSAHGHALAQAERRDAARLHELALSLGSTNRHPIDHRGHYLAYFLAITAFTLRRAMIL